MKNIIPLLFLISVLANPAEARVPLSISARGGFAFPISDLSTLFKNGYSVQGMISYNASEMIELYLSGGRAIWQGDNAAFNRLLNGAGGPSSFTLNVRFRMIPVQVGAKFYYGLMVAQPYIGFSYGLYFLQLDVSGTVTDAAGTTVLPTESQSFSKTALGIEAGFLIPVADHFAVDVNGTYGAIEDTDARFLGKNSAVSTPLNARRIRFVTLTAGVKFSF
jgi:opacity protein-like surface antigen